MKKHLLLLLLLTSYLGFSKSYSNAPQIKGDSTVYNKNTDIKEELFFKSDLKEKYNDEAFKYRDEIKKLEPKKVKKPSPIASGALSAFGSFMSYIFPFLLGIVIVLIVLKTFLGTDSGFWSFKNSDKKVSEKLVYEDEELHETDFNGHLKKAINNKNYRLATRYYYLALLKKLSDLKTIEYHKDKTNTEYLFEIENKDLRSQFHDVSYIYSYVWYGEFPIDAFTFKTVEKKYKSIFKTIN